MFSEYASKFLSQSQSRLSLAQNDTHSNRAQRNRSRPDSRTRAMPGYTTRRPLQGPYNSQISRFAFGSRTSNAPAPLFYSATDDFREEDDVGEHDREIADHYALQRSRRHFVGSHLSESSGADDDMAQRSDHTIDGNSPEDDGPGYGLGRGIKSSWDGGRHVSRGRAEDPGFQDREQRERSVPSSEDSAPSSKGKGKLVDVELSTVQDSVEHLEKDELLGELDNRPPAYQEFRSMPKSKHARLPLRSTLPIPQETDEETMLENPRPISPDRESVPQVVVPDPSSPPKHNFFWAELFIITQCALVGFFFISVLQESPPSKKHPLGDTMYTVLHSSFHLIGVYSLVSVVIGMLWLSLLRSFARPLIMLILVAVPVISFSFFLYPLIASYKGTWHGSSIQDKVMRWFSFVPLLFAIGWVYTVYKARHSITKATEMLEFSGRILQTMSPLLLVGLATLATVVIWSWIWMLMFTRLFLGGHFSSSKSRWIIDLTTWWLAAGFVLDYLWTLSVIAGLQRATTAATVSQWYFHRNNTPSPSPRTVVQASAVHATTVMAGTVCFSTFISLMIRAPLMVLPRVITGPLSLCLFSLVPTPIAVLTNPLTLTYASVHGMPLGAAARGLSNMSFVSQGSPTTTLGPSSFSSPTRGNDLMAFRLAKLLLHAIRIVMSVALGFGGWVSAARVLEIGNSGYKGSLYAYIVGLISGMIGWGALGAMESVLGGILDALLVCWGSEVGFHGQGEVRYCREAGDLFGERGSRR